MAPVAPDRRPTSSLGRSTAWAWLLLCATFASASPTAALATWERPRDILFGTAYTLPQGRVSIGALAPMAYGVHDRVTISTHPILDLLLALNASIRVNVVDAPLALSLGASWSQSFFVGTDDTGEGDLRLVTLVTLPAARWLVLTATGGYGRRLGVDVESLHLTGAAHVRFGSQDILMMQGGLDRYFGDERGSEPSGALVYAHAFDQLRLAGGVAAGRFPFRDDLLRIWPYLDIWIVF